MKIRGICTKLLLFTIFSQLTFADPSGDTYHVSSALEMEMLKVKVKESGNPVSFIMGSIEDEPGRLINENQHQVYLTKDYYLGKYEVTQAEYEAVIRGNEEGVESRPSNFAKTGTRPVESISWDEANFFVHLLNQKEKNAGRLSSSWSYSLPTEAEWEFACRAGTSTAFHAGNQITKEQANFLPNESNQTTVVGMFEPNGWGFYDMHGNVREWCSDWYHNHYEGKFVDPSGGIFVLDSLGNYRSPNDFHSFFSTGDVLSTITVDPKKVCRGGAFDSTEDGLRSARRYSVLPGNKLINLGFRLALRREESNATLEKSLTSNVVSFQSGNFYQFEVCWEVTSDKKTLESSGEKISDLLNRPNDLFLDDFSIRTIYSKNNSTISRPGLNGYEDVAIPAYEINATLDDGSVPETSLVFEVSHDLFHDFVRQSEPTLKDEFAYSLTDSNYSYDSSALGYIYYRDSIFSDTISQYLEHGNFLGNSSGWMRAEWFGNYFAESFPWVFHENLGWVYVKQDNADNAWLYRENLGWVWITTAEWWEDFYSNSQLQSSGNFPFPYLFRYGVDENDTKTWTYLNRTLPDTTLYDFNETEWFLLDQTFDIDITVLPSDGGSVVGGGQYYRWQNISLQAIPNAQYKFTKWDGHETSTSSDLKFFTNTDKSYKAVFLPLVSSEISPAMRLNSYKEIINGMTELTAQQRDWALVELLVYGRSTTAGIP